MSVRAERGAAALIVAISMSVLLGSAAISVDYGHMVYEQRRVQQAADAAARAVAIDCATTAACTQADTDRTAASMSMGNSGATSDSAGLLSASAGSYTVQVSKPVGLAFAALWGDGDGVVRARATATWSVRPREGTSLIPFAVPYCTYAQNLPPSTTHIRLRTDATNALSSGVSGGESIESVMTKLRANGAAESCETPDGPATMLFGPIPLSAYNPKNGGSPHWDSSFCRLKLHDYDQGFADISNQIKAGCLNKMSKLLSVDQIILVPIYVPASNLDTLGILADSCAGGGGCKVTGPHPMIDTKILGFAAFHITGFNFSTNGKDPDDGWAACPTVKIGSGSAVGCKGMQGYFVKSMTPDPDFEYGPGGIDFGVSSVKLTK